MGRGAWYRKPGFVCVWVGVEKPDLKATGALDILKVMCGVSSYDPDDQEVVMARGRVGRPVAEVVSQFSYSESFRIAANAAAAARGIDRVYWAVAQFDFAYHPDRVRGEVWADPVFLGTFAWADDDP